MGSMTMAPSVSSAMTSVSLSWAAALAAMPPTRESASMKPIIGAIHARERIKVTSLELSPDRGLRTQLHDGLRHGRECDVERSADHEEQQRDHVTRRERK